MACCCVGLGLPNARFQARRRAGARDERTLFAVACNPCSAMLLLLASATWQIRRPQEPCSMEHRENVDLIFAYHIDNAVTSKDNFANVLLTNFRYHTS